ncbi:MAG: polyamine aminopropyltransferase [Candidatus Latescibacteria bacterium]|nr:polyamine aminopropyltransferase [Candidatus Latescibacterota bacterium]NIO28446.1 polyamine aminopropyltransferase [Candidatus Latescibacterota bacterium]NIO55995.1 polyamine aminopropyltransferase [Candidatus Latescibacterota bacterium]NIT01959.1 polyamine aminopropyltransferase [Candidatus Latescibacterota bacterium]
MADWHDEVFNDRVRFGLKIRRSLYSGQSPYQKIDIFESEQFGRTLTLDGIYMTSEGDEYFYHEMLVHPAMTTAPLIRRILIIGGGDGGTAREVLRYSEVERVVMVEIDSMVVEACKEYLPSIGTAWDDPRLEVVIQDGVAYVKEAQEEPFDVILLDGSDPVGPAEGLFGEDFYHGCERLLQPEGVFALQSESPVLFWDVFLSIVRTLRKIFGRADPYFGSVPIYGAGMWTWTYATRSVDPMMIIGERIERVEPLTRYYNREIHEAAFALPTEIKKELER